MYCVTTLKELCSAVDAFGIVHFFAGAEEIKDSTPDPASKAFNKSRLHRLRHLMSLALPFLRSRYREATAPAAGLSKVWTSTASPMIEDVIMYTRF